MPLFLSKRQPELTEFMDLEDCDPLLLENTYRQFETINRLLAGWNRIYRNEIKPLLNKSRPFTLLDIGFGGGDVPVQLAKWARNDGFDLQITAIETDLRAKNFVDDYRDENSIEFKHCSTSDLITQKSTFDFVISNHLLHHLGSRQTETLLEEAENLATQKIIFNDIERSDLGYLLFSTFTPLLFRKSFIVADGKISIKKSFTKTELTNQVPGSWKVKRQFPFRLLLIHEK